MVFVFNFSNLKLVFQRPAVTIGKTFLSLIFLELRFVRFACSVLLILVITIFFPVTSLGAAISKLPYLLFSTHRLKD